LDIIDPRPYIEIVQRNNPAADRGQDDEKY
jgi:hypothetical protein